jgi:hypothetical protein
MAKAASGWFWSALIFRDWVTTVRLGDTVAIPQAAGVEGLGVQATRNRQHLDVFGSRRGTADRRSRETREFRNARPKLELSAADDRDLT